MTMIELENLDEEYEVNKEKKFGIKKAIRDIEGPLCYITRMLSY